MSRREAAALLRQRAYGDRMGEALPRDRELAPGRIGGYKRVRIRTGVVRCREKDLTLRSSRPNVN